MMLLRYMNGQCHSQLSHLGEDDRIITSGIPDRDGILQSIKDFLGKGR